MHDLVDKNLPSYCKLVGGIKFMDKLPRGSTGKIDRKQLKLLAKSYTNWNEKNIIHFKTGRYI